MCSDGDVLETILNEDDEKKTGKTNVKMVQWRMKRKTTTYICFFYAFFYALEYSCVMTSLLFYLKQDVRVTYPETWYSNVLIMLPISAAFSGMIVGKFVDQTRCLRFSMQLFTIFSLVGNLLYTFHQSVWFLMVGRFLTGLTDAGQAGILGEFSRIYGEKELVPVLAKYQSFYAIGYALGPGLPALFGKIDWQLGIWVLTQNNFVGVFMALLLAILLVAITFGVHDLSKDEVKKKEMQGQAISKTFSTIDILTSYDLVLLIISSAYLNFVGAVSEIVINLTAILEYKWSLTWLGISTALCTMVYFVIMNFIAKNFISGRVRCIFFALFPAACFNFLLTGLPTDIKIDRLLFQVIHVVVLIILNLFVGLTAAVFARTILFQIVPKSNASYVEGIRSAVVRFGSIFALELGPVIYNREELSIPLLASISLFFIYPVMFSKKLRPAYFSFFKHICKL